MFSVVPRVALWTNKKEKRKKGVAEDCNPIVHENDSFLQLFIEDRYPWDSIPNSSPLPLSLSIQKTKEEPKEKDSKTPSQGREHFVREDLSIHDRVWGWGLGRRCVGWFPILSIFPFVFLKGESMEWLKWLRSKPRDRWWAPLFYWSSRVSKPIKNIMFVATKGAGFLWWKGKNFVVSRHMSEW